MKKILLTLLSAVTVVLFWYVLGTGFSLKDDSNTFSKLQCVSYAPFGKDDSPFMMDKGLVISDELVKKDLQLLSKYTNCIRTYSTVGLEMIPRIARENNLTMLMGAWVNGDEKPTRKEIDTLIKLANENKDIVKAVIVGNEALLRGDLSAKKLSEYLKEVKTALPDIKVTYADVWEYWVKYPDIKNLTDFVTIHILPYWEDDPMNIHDSIEHLANVRHEVEGILKTSNILIGETGWPSEGRMREDALPSKTNQAIFVRDFVKLAEEKNWNYNIIEAFDQPWKRQSEGAVGGFWGLFDKDRLDKNVFAGDVSDFPNYKYLAFGSFFLVLVFSTLLRNKNISTKKIVGFTLVNTLFAVLYMLQVEQYNITVRTNVEFIWALLVMLTHIFIYYFVLASIIKERKADLIPSPLFYSSFIFVLISNIYLAFDGRYRNFEIYIFVISAISFLWLYKDRYNELDFGKFGKLSALMLLVTSILVIENETLLNIFSNIWVISSLIFAYILNKASKNVCLADLKNIIIYILVFFGIAAAIKYGFISNKPLALECGLNPDTLTCEIKDAIGYYLYLGLLGTLAIITSIVAIFKKNFALLALFLSIAAVLLFNTLAGAIGFVITTYILTKDKE